MSTEKAAPAPQQEAATITTAEATPPAWFWLVVDLVEEAWRQGFHEAELMLTAAMDAGELHQLADALNRDAASRARAAGVPPPWKPVDWTDALVRLPGESDEHYQWRRLQHRDGSAA